MNSRNTSAGLEFTPDSFHRGTGDAADITAEMLAYSIGAHHGLFDCMDAKQRDGFERKRQQAEKTGYAIEWFFTRLPEIQQG